MARVNNTGATRTVGIFIFNDVEVLDFTGPFEVFATTVPQGSEGIRSNERLFRVLTIAERPDTVTAVGGLLVQPHYTIDNHPDLDIIVVPGGRGAVRERTNPAILAWIKRQTERAELITSVCTGAFLLAADGLLDGKRATTHWGSIGWLRENYPAITVLDDTRVIDEGHIVTSAGVSAGIDMALHVVARLHGSEVAAATARSMEYLGDWQGATEARAGM